MHTLLMHAEVVFIFLPNSLTKLENFLKQNHFCGSKTIPQPAFSYSKLAIETLENGVKYVQS